MSVEAVIVGAAVVAALGYVLWRALKPQPEDGCDCAFKPEKGPSGPVPKP